MKEKTINTIIICLLMMFSTVLNTVLTQEVDSLSDLVENCSEPVDLTGDLDEGDSEDYSNGKIDERSLYSIDFTGNSSYQEQKSTIPIFNLITPPPQV